MCFKATGFVRILCGQAYFNLDIFSRVVIYLLQPKTTPNQSMALTLNTLSMYHLARPTYMKDSLWPGINENMVK